MELTTAGGLDSDALRAFLTDLLLRAPRRPEGPLFDWAVGILPEVAEWVEELPVVAVATAAPGSLPMAFVMMRERRIETDRMSELLGVPIRSVVTGEVRPAARPAVGGDSISGDGPGGDTGTLALVVENQLGEPLVLGCNHTLAGVNQSVPGEDVVLQPGADDGGDRQVDVLGTLADYRVIKLGGYLPNEIDAAVAEPLSPGTVAPGIRNLGGINGLSPPLFHGARVQKVGWCSGHTFGAYHLDTSCTLAFPGGSALFVNQYGIVGDDSHEGFAQQGDSGAAVLTDDNALVGMVTGVLDKSNVTFVTPIEPILNAFGVTPA